jgi:hypothetical protein
MQREQSVERRVALVDQPRAPGFEPVARPPVMRFDIGSSAARSVDSPSSFCAAVLYRATRARGDVRGDGGVRATSSRTSSASGTRFAARRQDGERRASSNIRALRGAAGSGSAAVRLPVDRERTRGSSGTTRLALA